MRGRRLGRPRTLLQTTTLPGRYWESVGSGRSTGGLWEMLGGEEVAAFQTTTTLYECFPGTCLWKSSSQTLMDCVFCVTNIQYLLATHASRSTTFMQYWQSVPRHFWQLMPVFSLLESVKQKVNNSHVHIYWTCQSVQGVDHESSSCSHSLLKLKTRSSVVLGNAVLLIWH